MYSRPEISNHSSNMSTSEDSRCNSFCFGYATHTKFNWRKKYCSSFMRSGETETTVILLERES